MMRVLNLSPLAGRLDALFREVRVGDHVLYFEHEEDGQDVRAILFCEKCSSEVMSDMKKAGLLAAASEDAYFVVVAAQLLDTFSRIINLDCSEAAKVVMCKEVLES